MSIPIRVDPAVRAHVVGSGRLLHADHPLVDAFCPVCDEPLGRYPDDERRGWTAAAVAVHDRCTDVEAPDA